MRCVNMNPASTGSRRRGAASWPRRGTKGFTLIELLVVLAIMALVVTLLAPMLRIGRSGADLRSASSEMLAAMRTARSLAIAQNRPTAILLDPVYGRYGEPRRYHLLPKGMTMSWRALWPVAGQSDLAAIYFFPDGSASGGEIDLKTGNAVGAIVVDWFSGLASLHEPNPR
jgi:general secretion pathway protein H